MTPCSSCSGISQALSSTRFTDGFYENTALRLFKPLRIAAFGKGSHDDRSGPRAYRHRQEK